MKYWDVLAILAKDPNRIFFAVEREEDSTSEYKLYVDNGGEIQCETRIYNDGARCMSSLSDARTIYPIPVQNIHALQKLNWIENLDILSFDKVIEHYTKDPGTVFDCRFYANHYQFVGTFPEVLKIAGNSKWDLLASDLVYDCEWYLHNGDTSWRP